MEAFPDLATLSDDDLRKLIKDLKVEEDEISYRRRLLHGKIDILRHELVSRLKRAGATEVGEIDIERLSEILSGKAAPPDAA